MKYLPASFGGLYMRKSSLNYSHLSQQGPKLRPGFSSEKLPYFVGYLKQHIWKFSHSKSQARSSLRSYPAVSFDDEDSQPR
jgi:hypothetical protein